MPGFGESLRFEREARNVTIEKIADETGIQIGYLEALENDEFHDLPGRAFGKLYIRAYARLLGFDPQPLIDEYDRELKRARPASTGPSAPSGSAPGRPVNSMIASWRQARIAERTRTLDDGASPDSAGSEEYPDDAHDDPAMADGFPADEAGEEQGMATEEVDVVAGLDDASEARDEGAGEVAAALVPSAVPVPCADAASSDVPVASSISTPRTRSRGPALAALTFGFLVVLSVVGMLSFRRKGSDEPALPAAVPAEDRSSPGAAAPAREDPVAVPPATHPAVEPHPTARPATGSTARAEDSPAVRRPASVPEMNPSTGSGQGPSTRSGQAEGRATLSVTESGVGSRIVDHRVEGQDERFPVSTVVWFQTRALGGGPGDAIRHVWIHDGKAVQSIRLRLGGPDWRTQSSKTLRHVGAWAVEARDKDGRVLARADFACERSVR